MKLEDELKKALKDSEQRQMEINELLNATNSILKIQDFESTARNIFDACARAIGARSGYVALMSDDGMENELLFLEDGGMPCSVNPELPMPIRGLRAEAYHTGKVVYDNNFMKSEWVEYMPKGHMDLPNVLFSPLNIEGKTVGIMGFACKDGDFNDHDAKIAAVFGEYAAIALLNSRTMQELKDRARELQSLNATKDKLFSIIAHDLRNPFNSIIGYSDLIHTKSSENQNVEIMTLSSKLHNSARNSYNLLNNLLAWARSQSGQITTKVSDFSLEELVKEVVDLYSLSARNKSIQIRYNVAGIDLSSDYDLLHTVLRNLLSNAIKFTNHNGEIHISAIQANEKVKVYVKDNGVGMPPEVKEKLFEIDEDMSKPGTNNEKGTGLGLILCKDFIEKLGGEFSLESEEGKGTVFKFSIPQKIS